MVFGGNLPNYTLVGPFNLVGKALHIDNSLCTFLDPLKYKLFNLVI